MDKSFSDIFHDPARGVRKEPLPDKKDEPKKPEKQLSLAEILVPLDEVFMDDALKDDIVTRVSIPDLLEGTESSYSGVILCGPPGTGKTVLLRAIEQVYLRAGAYAKDISASEVNSMWVGQFAKNLEDQIKNAIEEAKKRGKPSFLSFDEGSIIAQRANEGALSVSKHYQEAVDVLKKYVGNTKELVVAVSTNVPLDTFEEALIRDGRLTPYFIGYPNEEQRQRMWKHFTKKYDVMSLKEAEAQVLAEITQKEQGAFIEEFCRNYKKFRRQVVLKQKGFNSLVEALKKGEKISDKEITKDLDFEQFYNDVEGCLRFKYERMEGVPEEKGPFGFQPQRVAVS